MEISSQTNNYQQQTTQPIIQPIVNPAQPESKNQNLYEASNGNLINNKDGEIVLTPQGQNNISNKQEDNALEAEAASQEQKDAQRGYATDYLAHKSKQSQMEIYLSVATDSDVDLGNDTANIIESLRDVQKQNNAVEAYTTYQDNQQGGKPALY